MSLPHEVLIQITDYLDIPAIGAVAQTSKARNGSISQIVTSEDTWFNIVNVRFNICNSASTSKTSKTPRKYTPKHYGGRNWQDAYRNMSLSKTLPKMSVLFRKKSIFAKGTGYLMLPTASTPVPRPLQETNQIEQNLLRDNHNSKMSGVEEEKHYLDRTEVKKWKHQVVNAWVMINHTEDCTLRRISNDRSRIDMVRHNVNTDVDNPYIELHLAFQNTRSKFSTMDIDLMKTSVQMLCKKRDNNRDNNNGNGSHGGGGNNDIENDGTSILALRIIRQGSLKPKIIYRSIGGKVLYQDSAMKPTRRSRNSARTSSRDNTNDKNLYNYGHHRRDTKKHSTFNSIGDGASISPISLNPFEFVVVSVNVPLKCYTQVGENLRFETDFLSRAISVCTPVTLHVETKNRPSDDHVSSLSSSSILSVAYFASEKEIWESYTEISGNFIALNNRM